MRRVGLEALAALRDIWVVTFVEPVRDGRPQPRSWPRGLAPIGAATLVVYLLLAAAATFAVEIRRAGEITGAPGSEHTLPTATLPLLMTGLILSFAIAHTAALHTSWWLRIALFLLGAAATVFFAAPALIDPLFLIGPVAGYLGLLGFTLVRASREYAWWEFVVVTVLVATAMLSPWLAGGFTQSAVDPRMLALEGALGSLQLLALPAIVVAAAAPAQIVVTGSTAASSRPVGRVLFWTGAAAVTAWFVVAGVLAAGSEDLDGPALAGAAVTVLVTAAGLAAVLHRAGRTEPEPPRVYPEAWGPWLYPLAIAMTAVAVVILPVIVLQGLLQFAGLGGSPVVGALDLVTSGLFDNNPDVVWKAVLGLGVAGIAWRLGAAGRVGEAGFLVAFAVAVVLDAVGLLPGAGFLHDQTAQALGVVAGGVTLAGAVLLAVRRRLTRPRAAAALTVLLLAVLYPHRDLLADPASAVLVFSAPMVILFGLSWRILTDAQFTRTGSRHFPQSTRVLLFCANSLFACTSVAYLALARGTGTALDTSRWAALGETRLGDSLFLVALVAGAWLALRSPAHPGPAAADPGRVPAQSKIGPTVRVRFNSKKPG